MIMFQQKYFCSELGRLQLLPRITTRSHNLSFITQDFPLCFTVLLVGYCLIFIPEERKGERVHGSLCLSSDYDESETTRPGSSHAIYSYSSPGIQYPPQRERERCGNATCNWKERLTYSLESKNNGNLKKTSYRNFWNRAESVKGRRKRAPINHPIISSILPLFQFFSLGFLLYMIIRIIEKFLQRKKCKKWDK